METKSDNDSITSKEETWTDDINKLCFNLLDDIKALLEIHKNKYLYLDYYLSFFRIPLIIISSFNSVFSVGGTIYMNQQQVTVINSILSLVAGIISAVELYMQLNKKMEVELASFHSLKNLAIRISHQMKLNPNNRESDGTVFLNHIISEYKNIVEISLVNNISIGDKLFNYNEIQPTKGRLLEMIKNPLRNPSPKNLDSTI